MAKRIFILGAGRFGYHLAARLSEFGCEVLLADRNGGRVRELAEDGFNMVQLDAEDEEALAAAGAKESDAVVVCIGENLQASILATLALKQLEAKRIICRARDSKHAQVLDRVGADQVVFPSRDMAYQLAENLRDVSLSHRIPLSGDYQLARIRLSSQLHGQSLQDCRIREEQHINVVLISRPGREGAFEDFEPKPEFKFKREDRVLVVGTRENINRFEKEFGLEEV